MRLQRNDVRILFLRMVGQLKNKTLEKEASPMRTEVTSPREGTKHLGFHSTYCLSTSIASHMHDYQL